MYKALDLFSGAGGASMGLHRAGFDVTGVDIKPQPRYPFTFIQADAIEYALDHYWDFIWASPPCQQYTVATLSQKSNGKTYSDLVDAVRNKLLRHADNLWVIENTPEAPLRVDLLLCGSHFGLQTIRHRIFELNFQINELLPPCSHPAEPVTVCGHGTPSWMRARGINHTQEQKRDAMGIDWMNRTELGEAIPPAYSEFIGKQAIQHLQATSYVG